MTDFIKVVALGAATILTSRGLVHFDHESSDEKAREPEVPVDQVRDLVERGLIKDPGIASDAIATGLSAAAKSVLSPTDKRKAALARANAARAAKAAARKAGKAPAAAASGEGNSDAPAE